MILKKEQIANETINCYINLDNNVSVVTIGNETIEISLVSPKEIKSLDEFDIVANYLLRINKFFSFLKNKNNNYTNANIKIHIDNKQLIEIIKPNGSTIAKTSKELKKTIDNKRLKAILGITLQEFSNYTNIDLVFDNSSLKEVEKMDNTNLNFELDINNSNDTINLPEIDSLNYNEEDLFKEFDLNTENLFSEKKSEDFMLDDNDIIFPEYSEPNNTSVNINEDFIFENNEIDIMKETDFNSNNLNDNKTFDLDEDFFFETEDNFITENYNNDNDIVFKEDENTIVYGEKSSQNNELIYETKPEEINDIEEEPIFINENNETDLNIKTSSTKENNDKHTNNQESTPIFSEKIKSNNVTEKRKEIKRKKEEPTMNKIYKENNKTLDIKDDFIQNELIEIKNILKDKINSYSDTLKEVNSLYEEKHLALKDLNLTDEAQQINLFKEFLSYKSNMVNLKMLNDTCNDIISDIENKIFNIKK